jgi:hypothetical protein
VVGRALPTHDDYMADPVFPKADGLAHLSTNDLNSSVIDVMRLAKKPTSDTTGVCLCTETLLLLVP